MSSRSTKSNGGRLRWIKKTHYSSRRKARKAARESRRISRPMYR